MKIGVLDPSLLDLCDQVKFQDLNSEFESMSMLHYELKTPTVKNTQGYCNDES